MKTKGTRKLALLVVAGVVLILTMLCAKSTSGIKAHAAEMVSTPQHVSGLSQNDAAEVE